MQGDSRHPLETHAPGVVRDVMGRLSPEAMRTLRAVSQMRHRPPEEVLEEELRGYIADKVPLPNVEGLIRRLGEEAYALGYACGSVKRIIRQWKNSR